MTDAMKSIRTIPVLAVVALAVAVAPASVGRAPPRACHKSETMKGAVSMNAGEMTWMPAPPDLPKGGQMAVLHGDPSKSAPFTVRFKMPSGYKIPPHWHSKDEQLTVISGSFTLHMGDTMDAPATQLSAGGYHFLPGKMHHAAEGKGETIVQIDGMGPFDIHYLNPADNPTGGPAAS